MQRETEAFGRGFRTRRKFLRGDREALFLETLLSSARKGEKSGRQARSAEEMSSLANDHAAAMKMKPRIVYRHSVLVRVTHWINALCFAILLMSGLQIFNAHPELDWGNFSTFDRPFFSLTAQEDANGVIRGVTTFLGRSVTTTGVLGASRDENSEIVPRGFPGWITIPSYQDLATGRRWHFFFAWILALNGLVYVVNLLVRRRLTRDFLLSPKELRAIPHAIVEHARLRFPKGDEALHYNVLQKLAYLSVIIAFPILILAGLTMSPGMDSSFPWLLDLFGGRQSARAIHFIAAWYLVLFVIVHLVMVLVSGVFNNMRSMITGRYKIEEQRQ
jgi:thiosulfate reductase cytochrome b subunit